jgi:hypothetical protein
MNDDPNIGISVEAVKGCYVAIWRISHIGLTVGHAVCMCCICAGRGNFELIRW